VNEKERISRSNLQNFFVRAFGIGIMHVSIEEDPLSSLFLEEKENPNKIDKIEEI
jgi:hypothetical protein